MDRFNLKLVFRVFFCLLAACPVLGQVQQKKRVTEADYQLWHTIKTDKISADGNWISYQVLYATGDMMVVKNTSTGKHFTFPKGQNAAFSATKFACKDNNDVLQVLDLKKGIVRKFDNVRNYQLLDNCLLLFNKGVSSPLILYNLDGRKIFEQLNVTSFAVSPDKQKLAIATTDKGVLLYGFATKKPLEITGNNTIGFQNLTWSGNSSVLAFLSGKSAETSLYFYDIKNGLKVLKCEMGTFDDSREVERSIPLAISQNNKRIIFTVKKKALANDDGTTVEIWNAADRWIYPAEKEVKGFTLSPMQMLWEPESGRIIEITSADFPYGGAVGTLEYALTYNPKAYEPQIKAEPDRDIFLTDLNTGSNTLLLEKHDGNNFHLMASKDGRNVLYFKDGKWYNYNLKSQVHTEVSKGIPNPLSEYNDQTGSFRAFRSPGWIIGGQSVLLYDEYDLWQVFVDKKPPIRLTKGRESKIVYRIIPQGQAEKLSTSKQITEAGEFDLTIPLLLSVKSENGASSGYAMLSSGKVTILRFNECRTSAVVQTSDRKITAWLEERFDRPQEVLILLNGKVKSIVQSNQHQKNYEWGKTELINFKSGGGNPISGIVYYPAGFVKGKKYPMVVHVYQKQSTKVHQYLIPYANNGGGFNIANLTLKGYFVFLPDIVYDVENVGDAAVVCVENGVKEVLKSDNINPLKIGLIGHSFGAYQTNFIITKSKLFACAVAGAGDSDLISSTHVLDRNVNMPSFFKSEQGQFRILKSLAERKEYYIYNSPIFSAGDVTTPLLTWTGKDDTQVEPTQSYEFYYALRRLGKTHIMLAYPDEGHEIMQPQNTADLTKRVEQWFGYNLKEEPQQSWMVSK